MDRQHVRKNIREICNKAQLGHINTDSVAKELKAFYETCEGTHLQNFKDEFVHCLRVALKVFNHEPAVERTVEFFAIFLAKFACVESEDEEAEEEKDTLYDYIFNYLLKNSSATDKAVRYRICQLVKLMLQHVPKNAELNEDLVENITLKMLPRMSDIVPAVRAQAVRSLGRLQQPRNRKCPIIKEYLFFMRYDESADVRAAVLSTIAMTSRSLPSIILRTRDTKESVRRLAYQTLAKNVSIKALSMEQRLHLIEQGLYDQSQAVRKVVASVLLQAWINSYEGNMIEFLKNLDVIGAAEITSKAVKALFEISRVKDLIEGFSLLGEKNLMDYSKLSAESSTYWCMLCDFINDKGTEAEQMLDIVLPSLVDLCQYIKEYFNLYMNEANDASEETGVEHEYVAEQLLKISCICDLSDEAGRRTLNSLVHELLLSVSVEAYPCIVPPLAECFRVLHTSPDQRLVETAQILQEIREEKEDVLSVDQIREFNLQLAKLSVLENETLETLDVQIRSKLFEEATKTQTELDEIKQKKEDINQRMAVSSQPSEETIKDDPPTLLKCLQIIKVIIRSLPIFEQVNGKKVRKPLHPTAIEFVQSLILHAIACPHPTVRNVAVECLGSACSLSCELALYHLPLFLQVMKADTPAVRIKALEGVSDILRFHGTEVFANSKVSEEENEDDVSQEAPDSDRDGADNDSLTSVILQHMVDLLDEDDDEIRLSTTKCLIQILVNGCVVSSTIFMRLILMWYNPTLQDDHRTINQITSFLDFYPYMNNMTQQCVGESFLPILRTLQEAPNTSPLSTVNIGNVAHLLACLTKPSVIKDAKKHEDVSWLKDFSSHDEIALQICTEILRFPRSVFVQTLCKILDFMELTTNDTNLNSLLVLCDEMCEKIKYKNSLRSIKKFQSYVKELLPNSQTFENAETTIVEQPVTA